METVSCSTEPVVSTTNSASTEPLTDVEYSSWGYSMSRVDDDATEAGVSTWSAAKIFSDSIIRSRSIGRFDAERADSVSFPRDQRIMVPHEENPPLSVKSEGALVDPR